MNKRKDILDTISANYIVGDKNAEVFLMEMYIHYIKLDLEIGGNLALVFKELYMSDKKLSYDEISYKFSIGLTTLQRYRKRFNSLAEKMLLR